MRNGGILRWTFITKPYQSRTPQKGLIRKKERQMRCTSAVNTKKTSKSLKLGIAATTQPAPFSDGLKWIWKNKSPPRRCQGLPQHRCSYLLMPSMCELRCAEANQCMGNELTSSPEVLCPTPTRYFTFNLHNLVC